VAHVAKLNAIDLLHLQITNIDRQLLNGTTLLLYQVTNDGQLLASLVRLLTSRSLSTFDVSS
jgi:hypothetical protein